MFNAEVDVVSELLLSVVVVTAFHSKLNMFIFRRFSVAFDIFTLFWFWEFVIAFSTVCYHTYLSPFHNVFSNGSLVLLSQHLTAVSVQTQIRSACFLTGFLAPILRSPTM